MILTIFHCPSEDKMVLCLDGCPMRFKYVLDKNWYEIDEKELQNFQKGVQQSPTWWPKIKNIEVEM